MKHSIDPADPLLQSLVEETNQLPLAAAAMARSQRKSRAILRNGALILAALLLAAAIWLPQRNTSSGARNQIPVLSETRHDFSPFGPQGFVHAYRSTEENIPAELPKGASKEEKELLRELPDVPVLIVKNQQGEIARVQILER